MRPDELATLLLEVGRYVRRYVVLGQSEIVIVALWVMHTHLLDAAETTPYLAITSPEKQAGKTRMLEALDLVVARPWFTGRTTAAALARKVDAELPTLLLDESDAAFKGDETYSEALRALLNTGYRRGGKTTLCVGQGSKMSYVDLSTFAPKAIAGIGSNLPDTVLDRSIPIQLKRRAPDERVDRFRRRTVEPLAAALRARLESAAAELVDELTDAEPQLPDELSDRAADVCEPLIAIADRAGEQWGSNARNAALRLCGVTRDDESIGVQLLQDIRAVFESRDTERLASTELVSELNGLEASPWGGWRNGNGMDARQVARRLKAFGIAPKVVRIGEATPHGYSRDVFADAWKRYLSLERASIRNIRNNGLFEPKIGHSYPQQDPGVLRIESARKPHEQANVAGVAATAPYTGEAA